MGANTNIEWCDHTVNFWWGCTFANFIDGSFDECCRNCYAHLLSKLFSRGKATWGPRGNRWIRHEAARRELYKLDKAAFAQGVRRRVFINSMSDTFEGRDDLAEAREMLWGACQFITNLDIILLTKRPQNVRRMVPEPWLEKWPAHVWIGTTVGSQKAADERIPELLNIPARVRFLSCEPLLEEVDLSFGNPKWRTAESYHAYIHWVICGGESGPKARPMHLDWARSLRDQCVAAGVPFLFKQWGEWMPLPVRVAEGECHIESISIGGAPAKRVHDFGDGYAAVWAGKKEAGRLLDGIEHNAFPEVAP